MVASLAGTAWVLIPKEGLEHPWGDRKLEFGVDGRFDGDANDCNFLSGVYDQTGTSVRFLGVATTVIGCDQRVPPDEKFPWIASELLNTRFFEIVDGRLLLLDVNGETVLRFARAEAATEQERTGGGEWFPSR